jgi:hypothetical protein
MSRTVLAYVAAQRSTSDHAQIGPASAASGSGKSA